MHFPYAAKISTTAHGPFIEASGPGPLRVLLMLGLTAFATMGAVSMAQHFVPRRQRKELLSAVRALFG